MKRIRVLTIHFGVNHGSVLQAYALTKYLGNLGYDAKTIDYIPKRYRIWNVLIHNKRGKYPLPLIVAYYPLLFFKLFPLKNMFRRFCKKNLSLTKFVSDTAGLKEIADDGDIFIAGSDQVWNEDYNGLNEFSYYFDFLPYGKTRIGYGASFGKEDLFEEEYGKKVIGCLEKFERIGMRESAGVEKLAHYGIKGTNVCDPTMLLTKEEWREFSRNSKYRKPNNDVPYILIYAMDGVYDRLLEYARIVKEKYGYAIYVVAFNKISDKCIDKMIYRANPKDFVALVDGASCVITNSFHGTVFSIIFGKPSLIIGKGKYNSRMLGTLEKIELMNHFIPKDSSISTDVVYELIEDKEPLERAQVLLGKWIKESKDFLDSALE